MAKLTEQEQQEIIRFMEAGKPLPDKFRFLLFEDKREVELVWSGKTGEVCTVVLPFQIIEQVDEPRYEKELKLQPGLFDAASGRQLKGWTNKLIWGDNKLRNLSELAATVTLINTFKKAINALTVRDKGDAEIRDTIKLRQTRPFVTKDQGYLVPKKSVFNKIIGDSHFELLFARFLDDCEDVIAFAKNYMAVSFKLDYVNANGDISNYYPDFMVKLTAKEIFIVETKGQVDLDVPLKMARLKQ